ncbi:MAG: alpha/beta hydrolase [Proteobacteria bacterium]|nr:alpha/beta hydrolase [Pseudomonadota bacterium]
MDAPSMESPTLALRDAAVQHGPRPLPLFLDMVREQTEGDAERRAGILAGLRAYQTAERPLSPPAMPTVARVGRATLHDFGGKGRPAVFVPSLINPPIILDLAEDNSLLRWLSGQGVRPLLVDWGDPTQILPGTGRGTAPHSGAVEGPHPGVKPGEDADPPLRSGPLHHASHGPPPRAGEDLSVAGHVTGLLLPLIEQLNEPAHLVGYCLGGTMALAAAMHAELLSLTLIASPWHYAGFGQARDEIASLWQAAKPSSERMGLVPMEVLQSGFWRLDPWRTVTKYEKFGQLDRESAEARAFIALEDWANAGAPLTYGAGHELFEEMIGADVTGNGGWRVGGEVVDPAKIAVPTLEFVSLHDRIVPAASSARLPDQRLLGLGHVGMIVGSRAREQLWEPLAAMLSQAQRS